MLIEDSISSYSEDEVQLVISFFKKIWEGILAATSVNDKCLTSDLLRQCIARRRIHWLSKLLMRKFLTFVHKEALSFLSASTSLENEHLDCHFQEGMWIYVNEWMVKGGKISTFSSITCVE